MMIWRYTSAGILDITFSVDGIDMAIWRYTTAGILDVTFNGTGYAFRDRGDGYSITTDAGGNIFVAGNHFNGTNEDMAIWRYTSGGELDTTFNGTGIVYHDNVTGGDGDDFGKSMTLDSNGEILITGYSENASGTNDMVIWKYWGYD